MTEEASSMKAVEWTPTCSKLRAQKRGNYERITYEPVQDHYIWVVPR